MKKKNFVSEPIKGTDWHFYLERPSTYKKKHGSDSDAIMYPREKEIYFNYSVFDTNVVKHELIHAYVSESNTISSPDFTKDDMEDLIAEIFGEHGEYIIYQATKIHNKLLALFRKE